MVHCNENDIYKNIVEHLASSMCVCVNRRVGKPAPASLWHNAVCGRYYVLDLAQILIVGRLCDANADAEQCEGHKYHGYRRAHIEETVGNDMRNAAQVHGQFATEWFGQQSRQQIAHRLCNEHYATCK